MSVSIRQVRGLAGGLAIIALTMVFATAGGLVPADSLPRTSETVVDTIPDVNAVISLLAIPIILYGWYAIRRGAITRHRYAMSIGFVLFVAFLGLYLYKVALEGPTPFEGPELVATYLYLPVLVVHVLLAMVCVPLLFYVLLLGITQPITTLPESDHPRVGRVAVTLWVISFGMGLVVYALLYLVY